MRVRILFYCPHCGSLLFRPSQARTLGDSLLRPFGMRPQRCQMCRLRFYLFKPARLRSLLLIPDRVYQPRPIQPASAESRTLVTWELARRNATDGRRRP
jgi:predicted RNA-binding Zn-ribbon protein involved in translation (DUF1610 family)